MMTLTESLDIVVESFDLELELINRDFNYANGISMIEGVSMTDFMDIFEERAKKEQPIPEPPAPAGGEKKTFFSRVLDSIVRFFQNINDRIASHFTSGEEDVDLSDYMNSDLGKVQLEYDLDKVETFVNKQFLKGRKLVQLISSASGVSDEKVAAFCDECTQSVIDNSGPIIEFFAIDRVREKIANKSFKKIDKWVSDLRKVETWDEKRTRVGAELDAQNAAAERQKMLKKESRREKQAQQKQKVANALAGFSKKAANAKSKVYWGLTRTKKEKLSSAKKKKEN